MLSCSFGSATTTCSIPDFALDPTPLLLLSPPLLLLQAAEAAEAVLTQQRYAQLDALLNKAGMYTKFLTEQMQTYAGEPGTGSQQEEEEDVPAGKPVGHGGAADACRMHGPLPQ